MAKFIDINKRIDITCPACKKKLSPRISELSAKSYACPGCGALFDAKKFAASLDGIEKQLGNLGRLFKK